MEKIETLLGSAKMQTLGGQEVNGWLVGWLAEEAYIAYYTYYEKAVVMTRRQRPLFF